MNARRMAIGLLALAALVFVSATASAGDTVRLSLPGDASAPTLDLKATPDDLASDTLQVGRGYHGGGYHGGYHGGYRGGYHGGYRGYYGGYRGYYGGYRAHASQLPYYGGYRGYGFRGGYYGGYRGYYGGGFRYYGGYWPRYGVGFYGAYSPSYSYYPSYSGYSYSSGAYCSPIVESSTLIIQPRTTVLRPATPSYDLPAPSLMPQADEQPQLVPSQPGTYPYDGGPNNRIPMPPAEESSTSYPRLSKPALVEDLVVKLPGKSSSGKRTYPAYGETPSR